jgi:uncharacterized protein involved in exopolysaccharide biosynthesis
MNVTAQNVEDEGFDLVGIIRLLWSYRILLAVSIGVCVAVAVVRALLAPEIFRAEAAVVEVRENALGGMGGLASQLGGLAGLAGLGILGEQGDDRDALPTLKSRRLVEQFVTRYKLAPLMLRNSKNPPTAWYAVERFRKSVLTIREDKRTGVVTIGMDWTDPAVATRWANLFVAMANESIRTRTIEESSRNIKYLNEQISKTNVLEMQKVMYNLIEAETKKLMLANGRVEYAFKVIDPAVKPELRIAPKRTVMVIIGGMLGGTLGCLLIFTHRLWVRLRVARTAA